MYKCLVEIILKLPKKILCLSIHNSCPQSSAISTTGKLSEIQTQKLPQKARDSRKQICATLHQCDGGVYKEHLSLLQ